MPTVIDALVVTLGLDSSDFKKGQDDTAKALDATKRQANEAAKGITEAQSKAQAGFAGTGEHASGAADLVEKSAKRTNQALRSVDVQASSVGKSIAASGKSMLTPFAEFAMGIGAAVLSIDTIRKAISQAGVDSAIGRNASMSGIPVGDYSTFGKASQLLGGDSTAAMGTMSNLAMQQQAALLGQVSPQMQLLEQLGIRANQPLPDIMRDLNRRLQGMPKARQSYILSQLGMDPGTSYLEEQTPAAYDATITKAANDKISSPQAEAEQKITEAYQGVLEALDGLTRELTVEASPALVSFAHTLTNFITGFQQSSIYKTFAAANAPATGLNTVQSAANSAGAWVHKWFSAALGFPSSSANPLPGIGPRGLRNNNPLNLKYAGQPGAHADSGGFAVFGSMESGVSADYHQMLLDYGRGDNTVNKLIPAWTTTDRGAYTATVLKQMRSYGYDISGDSPIDLTNPAVAQAMMASMSIAEGNGKAWLPPASGFALPKSVTSVLAGIRSGRGSGGSATHINVTVNAPSGDPHAIAHVVKRELQKQTTQTKNAAMGTLG